MPVSKPYVREISKNLQEFFDAGNPKGFLPPSGRNMAGKYLYGLMAREGGVDEELKEVLIANGFGPYLSVRDGRTVLDKNTPGQHEKGHYLLSLGVTQYYKDHPDERGYFPPASSRIPLEQSRLGKALLDLAKKETVLEPPLVFALRESGFESHLVPDGRRVKLSRNTPGQLELAARRRAEAAAMRPPGASAADPANTTPSRPRPQTPPPRYRPIQPRGPVPK